jgi:hypothetical protein
MMENELNRRHGQMLDNLHSEIESFKEENNLVKILLFLLLFLLLFYLFQNRVVHQVLNVLVSDCPGCPLTEKNKKKQGESVLTIWDVSPEQKLKTFKEGSTLKIFGVNPHKVTQNSSRIKNFKVFNKTKYLSILPPPSFKSVFKERKCVNIGNIFFCIFFVFFICFFIFLLIIFNQKQF